MKTSNAAFVGLSGPIGYAYGHERPKLDNESSSPNAVLENVAGLIICYDDIYFLSRQFCPVDMWNLPYVHFLLEEYWGQDLATTAIRQAHDLIKLNNVPHGLNFSEFGRITTMMQGDRRDARIDNHTHGIQLGTQVMSGDANRPLNVVTDMLLAQALSLQAGPVDLIISSPAASSLTRRTSVVEGIDGKFDHPKVALAQEVTALKTRNFLSSLGSYDERYEDLRHHAHIQEFRSFLTSATIDANEVARLAVEVNRLADDYAGRVMASRYNKNWYRSLGVPVLKGLGNSVLPFAGTAAGTALEFILDRGKEGEKKAMAWAPFVFYARRL